MYATYDNRPGLCSLLRKTPPSADGITYLCTVHQPHLLAARHATTHTSIRSSPVVKCWPDTCFTDQSLNCSAPDRVQRKSVHRWWRHNRAHS
jgi:hypothetical protein